MACEQVRHNRPATWHRVPATWLPCCTGVAEVHGVNGQQCSHEDEKTRISLAEQRSAQTERCRRRLEDCVCRALQTHRNGLQLHGSRP